MWLDLTGNDDEAVKEGKVNGVDWYRIRMEWDYATVVAAVRDVLGLGNEAVIDSGYTW